MSKRNLVRCVVLSVAMIAVCGLINQFAVGADAGPIAVGMDTFSNPDGVNYFALSLKPRRARAGRRSARRGDSVQHVGQPDGRLPRQGARGAQGPLGRLAGRAIACS